MTTKIDVGHTGVQTLTWADIKIYFMATFRNRPCFRHTSIRHVCI